MRLSILHFAIISLIIGLLIGTSIYKNEVLPVEHEPNIKIGVILLYCKIYNTSFSSLQNNLASYIVVLNITNLGNKAIKLYSIRVIAGEGITKYETTTNGYIVNMPIFGKTIHFHKMDISSYIPSRKSKYISINGVAAGINSKELPMNLSILITVSSYSEANYLYQETTVIKIPLNKSSSNEYYYSDIPKNTFIQYDEDGEIEWIQVGG